MPNFNIQERKEIYHLCKRLVKEYGYKTTKTKNIWRYYKDSNYIEIKNQKDIKRKLYKGDVKVIFLEGELPGENIGLYADNINCWVKPNRCSIILDLPKTENQFQFLVGKLEFLNTREGLEWATSYSNTIWDYPKEL